MPIPHHSVFPGRMLFLSPNQQRQSTEGLSFELINQLLISFVCISYLTFYDVHIIGRPFVKRFTLYYQTVVCPVCLSVCDVDVFWPNGWMDQDETWRGSRSRPRPHCVRWDPAPRPERGTPPIFGPCLLWPNCWMEMPLGTKVGVGPGDVLD